VRAVVSGTFHRRLGQSIACTYPIGRSGGLGLFGEIDTSDMTVLYGHLEAFAAADGSAVAAGQVIGFEGSSGCSSGSHLHFEVDMHGKPVNPCALLPEGYPVAHDRGNQRCWGTVPP
jgi:murein DD-endopeptidase MepM/ murein hydrolase activator NlpD